MRFLEHLFSFEGRIGRLNYFLHILLVPLVSLVLIFLLKASMNSADKGVRGFLISVVAIIAFISEISAIARRLHDLNHSAWYMLWTFIPIANLILAFRLLFSQGTEGSNQFGSDPLEVVEKSPVKEFSGTQFKGAKRSGGRFDRG